MYIDVEKYMKRQYEVIDQIRNRIELRPDSFTIRMKNFDLPVWFWEEIRNAGYGFSWKGETLTLTLEKF